MFFFEEQGSVGSHYGSLREIFVDDIGLAAHGAEDRDEDAMIRDVDEEIPAMVVMEMSSRCRAGIAISGLKSE